VSPSGMSEKVPGARRRRGAGERLRAANVRASHACRARSITLPSGPAPCLPISPTCGPSARRLLHFGLPSPSRAVRRPPWCATRPAPP